MEDGGASLSFLLFFFMFFLFFFFKWSRRERKQNIQAKESIHELRVLLDWHM